MGVDTSTRRRRATIGVIAFAAVGIVLLVGKAEGAAVRLRELRVAFIVSFAVAALLERRRHFSHRRAGRVNVVAVGLAAALAVFVLFLDVPFIVTGVAGAATGAIVGLGSMIIVETSEGGRRRG